MDKAGVLALANKVLDDGVHDTAAACEELAQGVLDLQKELDSSTRSTDLLVCNSGHEIHRALWDCPVCVDQIRAENERLKAEIGALKENFDTLRGDHASALRWSKVYRAESDRLRAWVQEISKQKTNAELEDEGLGSGEDDADEIIKMIRSEARALLEV